MDKQGDIEALRALVRDHGSPSKISRIREIFDEIEATQRGGVPNKLIVEALNARGYDLTFKTFETILHRIRKEREADHAKSNHPSSIPKNSPRELNQPIPPGEEQSRKISTPADLRKARQRDLDLEDYIPPD